MKKADFILIAVVLSVSVLFYFACTGIHQKPADELRVHIFLDGEIVKSEKLSDKLSPIIVDSSYGRNVIEVSADAVAVTWSDCPSQICVRTGQITRPGEVIACLPHRLLITLEGGRPTEDVDAVSG